uniref:Uncharacterized protein n=1 Tax=Anguilla anguilla TaxID=7936 RepID=A0A0E9VZD6_ANGAN
MSVQDMLVNRCSVIKKREPIYTFAT